MKMINDNKLKQFQSEVVARSLTVYRNKNKLTQKELGDKIGKSQSTIAKYESGNSQYMPNEKTVEEIADRLGIAKNTLTAPELVNEFKKLRSEKHDET